MHGHRAPHPPEKDDGHGREERGICAQADDAALGGYLDSMRVEQGRAPRAVLSRHVLGVGPHQHRLESTHAHTHEGVIQKHCDTGLDEVLAHWIHGEGGC